VDRGGPRVACETEAEVSAFYRHGGALLGLVHALGGTDLHDENIIARRDQPVPVDLETVLQPCPRRSEDGGQAVPLTDSRAHDAVGVQHRSSP